MHNAVSNSKHNLTYWNSAASVLFFRPSYCHWQIRLRYQPFSQELLRWPFRHLTGLRGTTFCYTISLYTAHSTSPSMSLCVAKTYAHNTPHIVVLLLVSNKDDRFVLYIRCYSIDSGKERPVFSFSRTLLYSDSKMSQVCATSSSPSDATRTSRKDKCRSKYWWSTINAPFEGINLLRQRQCLGKCWTNFACIIKNLCPVHMCVNG